MKFGSLFAGIGGLDLGLERAGMQCAWQVEIDDYCSRVLAKHWPEVKRYGDVRECGAHNLEAVDLICGGFPCQPHSIAGKRKGKADDRNLWPEYRRIVAELRPQWVLGENVPGIITTMLDKVLSDLESEGYTWTTLNLPACAFDAPHRRERIFIVAHTTSSDARQSGEQSNHQCTRPHSQSERRGLCRQPTRCSEAVADASQLFSNGGNDNSQHRPRPISRPGNGVEETRLLRDWWSPEPDVGRVADGVPARVDRLRALGNTVVPQVAEWIGQRIVAFEEAQ